MAQASVICCMCLSVSRRICVSITIRLYAMSVSIELYICILRTYIYYYKIVCNECVYRTLCVSVHMNKCVSMLCVRIQTKPRLEEEILWALGVYNGNGDDLQHEH